ncbi:hypothetical protein QFZ63_005571 [Streptomyces sp. B3I7]|nr:hypothetical protein [Streptomyces sp. B3I7]
MAQNEPGRGQPDRPDERDQRHDHPEQREPRLALAQGEQREREVDGDTDDDTAAVPHFLTGHVVDAERQEPDEDQPDQGRRHHHDLHAPAPGLGPVDVVQVQDQRELVEHQARADAEHHGERAGGEAVPAAGDGAEAAEDGEDDAGHHVVDVRAARADVAEGALSGPDHAGDDAGEQEGEDERAEREQQGQFARLDDVTDPPMSHKRTLFSYRTSWRLPAGRPFTTAR